MEIKEVIVSILCAAPAQKLRGRVVYEMAQFVLKVEHLAVSREPAPLMKKRYPVTASYPDYGSCHELF